jgi:hypothetical protein
MAVEVIDGRNFFSSPMMHETKELEITIGSHTSKVVFNVISPPNKPYHHWVILVQSTQSVSGLPYKEFSF